MSESISWLSDIAYSVIVLGFVVSVLGIVLSIFMFCYSVTRIHSSERSGFLGESIKTFFAALLGFFVSLIGLLFY